MQPTFQMSADARLLRQALARISVGETITFKTLSDAIAASVDSSTGALRTALRSLLRNERMVFGSVRGIGFMRLDDAGIVAEASSHVDSIRRKARRSVSRLTAVSEFDKLTPKQQLAHTTHLAVFTSVADLASDKGIRKIEKVASGRASELPIADTLKAFLG